MKRIFFLPILLIFFSFPAFALDISMGWGGTYYYSTNAAAGGFPLELNLNSALTEKTYARLSHYQFDYYGQLQGLRLAWEHDISIPLFAGYHFNYRAGIFYGAYWGNPIILIKDDYVDELPKVYNEIGITFRPFIFTFDHLKISALDISYGIDPFSKWKKINLGFTLINFGYTL